MAKTPTKRIATQALKVKFQPWVNRTAGMPLIRWIIRTTVAKGENVIDKAQPHEIDKAISVGSAGISDKLPNRLPKKIAIMIGLNPKRLNRQSATGKPPSKAQSGIE